MSVSKRLNVRIVGAGPKTMLLAHGYGCDQTMWRHLVAALAGEYRIVLFDYVGHGQSDAASFEPERYASLHGYAEDLLEICRELELTDAVFVGHSVSAMIGWLAAARDPSRFSHLVLIGPSPCYLEDGDYHGGFGRANIEGLLEFLDTNPLGWSQSMAPVIMSNPDRPELAEELANSFCRTDPAIAQHFARVTFLSDNRPDLAPATVPVLILQCRDDAIAPLAVGQYVHRRIEGSRLVVLEATGHCPHLSAPGEVIDAIREFLRPEIARG